jgi:hypothetical protein
MIQKSPVKKKVSTANTICGTSSSGLPAYQHFLRGSSQLALSQQPLSQYDTRHLKQAGQHGRCLARTRRTTPWVVSSTVSRISCSDDGSELLTKSIRWLTSSRYRICQVFPLQPAPKVRKIRFKCSKPTPFPIFSGFSAARQFFFENDVIYLPSER